MCFAGFARGQSTIFVYSVEARKMRRDTVRDLGLVQKARHYIKEFTFFPHYVHVYSLSPKAPKQLHSHPGSKDHMYSKQD